eukprot:TRINITY_DN1047_c0_g2_i1.p1 TRINITY_DN1047_c0_g2~~TRINITY_DN1047_c0_g2_i1.p1  ORF type:complete len:229 (+),score=49.11 TRINITY_DN1047_c0_g2_i1:193-879(+)
MSGRPGNRGIQAVYEDEDDWLVSYLAGTKYGTDPKLNSVSNKVPPMTAQSSARKPKLGAQRGMKNNMPSKRMSWTSPRDENLQTAVHPAMPGIRTNKMQPSPLSGGASKNVKEEEAKSDEESGEGEENWVASAGSNMAAASGSDRRSSITGRRQSLDYTDLEAVKERVMQAASLWAIADDEVRENSVQQLATKIAEKQHVTPEVAHTKAVDKAGFLTRWISRPSWNKP